MDVDDASPSDKVWTIAEAKARLSEVLRLSESAPQRIGAQRAYVVAPERVWREATAPARAPLGRYLLDHAPAGAELAAPDRTERDREPPFAAE